MLNPHKLVYKTTILIIALILISKYVLFAEIHYLLSTPGTAEATLLRNDLSRSLVMQIRNISYWLDHIHYSGNARIKRAIEKPEEIKSILVDLIPYDFANKPTTPLFIQSNRKASRIHRCSGNCRFCYIDSQIFQQRLKETNFMSLAHIKAILKKAIELKFKLIQLNGEDTLDDPDSFWAIVDACKDKSLYFSFSTNGIYLLKKNPDEVEAFFNSLKERLGIASLTVIFSWDMNLVKRLKNDRLFNGDEDAVFKSMAQILHSYYKVFKPSFGSGYSTPQVNAHDADTGNSKQAFKARQKFFDKLNRFLPKNMNKHVELYSMSQTKTEFLNPTSVERAINDGRIFLRLFSVNYIRSIIKKNKRGDPCKYTPFLDVAMSEMRTCIQKPEYPRRAVTPDNFIDTLFKPFFNPRTMHLFRGTNKERIDAKAKQLGFALALDPLLKDQRAFSFEEVESDIFSNEELITKIEFLYLLEDILYMRNEPFGLFNLTHIPRDLVPVCFNRKLLNALLTYYSLYSPDEYPPVLAEILKKYHASPDEAINDLCGELRDHIIPFLSSNGIISSESMGPAPEGLSRSVNVKERKDLPTPKNLGFNVREQLLKSLSSGNTAGRKLGFTLLGTLIDEKYNLNELEDILTLYLTPENLTREELIVTIELLGDWMRYPKTTKRKSSLQLIEKILRPFLTNTPHEVIKKAAKVLSNLNQKIESSPALLPKSSRLHGEIISAQ